MIREGDEAPDFTLKGVDGEGGEVEVTLSEIDGPVILYFYPKDDTPGCTTQACGLRDEWTAFRQTDATVLGVSPDDVDSHRKFSEKYDLPFTLLSDTENTVAEAYDVWTEKTMFGNTFMGVERSTFIIEDGRVTHAFRKVKPKKHADQVLEALS
ncbi:MAG: thioredoxin-dependent thiol peroxidase [Candidatus Longimicrobiales bacterium M2_2A_002]